jgi:hypothetical protein
VGHLRHRVESKPNRAILKTINAGSKAS